MDASTFPLVWRSPFGALLLLGACGVGPVEIADAPEEPFDGGAIPVVPRDSEMIDAGTFDSGTPITLPGTRQISAISLEVSKNPSLTADVAGVLTGTAFTLTVPAAAAVTALTPSLTFVGQSVFPASGTAQNFTNPVTYTVTAQNGESTAYVVTVKKAAVTVCTGTAAACSLDVYNRAVAFAASHPKHTATTSWQGWCGGLMMQFGGFAAGAPTAIAAYRASVIVSTDPTTAPIGAFHYWNLGTAGHVGVDLLGEGAVVFMASTHVADSWNPYIGVNSVVAYSAASGGSYLGWSMEYNGHAQRLAGGGPCGAAAVPSGCTIPRTPAQTTGVPDMAFVMLLQKYSAAHGYSGSIDGRSNAATWAGVQRGLQAQGYTGPTNGLPGGKTYEAFQRLAASYGYTGPVNGILGPNSFRGFAKFLNQTY